MASKEKVIKDLAFKTYSYAEVRHLLESINGISAPEQLKKGDVFIHTIGKKPRPVVIIKVFEDIVLGIPLSTTEDCLNFMESKSRFFGEGWFSKCIVCAKVDFAKETYCGVYDNPKHLNNIIDEMKFFLNHHL